MSLTSGEKAEQIERDFGVPHPRKRMFAGLNRNDEREVTPFNEGVAIDRIAGLCHAGWEPEDACVILLMRGARREVVAAAVKESVGDFIAGIRDHIRKSNLDAHVGEALRNLNLSRTV